MLLSDMYFAMGDPYLKGLLYGQTAGTARPAVAQKDVGALMTGDTTDKGAIPVGWPGIAPRGPDSGGTEPGSGTEPGGIKWPAGFSGGAVPKLEKREIKPRNPAVDPALLLKSMQLRDQLEKGLLDRLGSYSSSIGSGNLLSSLGGSGGM